MGDWIDHVPHYRPDHPHLLLGRLRPDQYAYLKTVTFFVNPDQLSLLITGAHYHRASSDPEPVVASFAAGCGLLVPVLEDLDAPQAAIGATDIASRRYLPPNILAFTVTRSMFERLCRLDEHSFLHKAFWKKLQKVRNR